MKIYDPQDSRYSVVTHLEMASHLKEWGYLSSDKNYVRFLNTGELGLRDSLRFFVRSWFYEL